MYDGQTLRREAEALRKQYEHWGFGRKRWEYLAAQGTEVQKKAAWREIVRQAEAEKERRI